MEKKTSKDNSTPKPNPPKKTKKNAFNIYWVYGLLFLVFIALQFGNFNTSAPEEITLDPFIKDLLAEGKVQKVEIINGEFAEVYIKDSILKIEAEKETDKSKTEKPKAGPHYKFNIPSIDVFEERVEKFYSDNPDFEKVQIKYTKSRDWLSEVLSWVLPIGLLIVFWIFIMRRMGGGAGGGSQIFNIGKAKAQLFDKDTHITVNFKDVAGLEEAKVEIMEIVDFLKNPLKYTQLGGKIPKGVLLVGPPGTGKTLLAKAVAGEAQVPFFSLSGSDFVEMFVGVGASRVRDLFKQAKEKSPCIIFIDEIDAVGRARGKANLTGANDERENTLNQLLTEMDGFSNNQGVIILAATNRADVLDKALLRAGRFDRQIHVEMPDIEERKAIFRVHAKPLRIDDKTVDLDFLAKQTPGFSGADIANVCNEAALIASRKDKKAIEKQDFLDAIDRIIGGLEKKNKIISPSEKRVIAFHEAGHASLSWLLEYAHPLIKVTIVPRGKALGAAWYLPEERQITTTEQMFDEITSTLGGRAAEEIIFGRISTGALNDLEKVTKQAYAMVAYFGLNKVLGNISYYDSTGQGEYSFTKPFSEKTAQTIDEEVSKIIETAYKRALTMLNDNKEKLEKLAKILIEKEVIFKEDVEAIFGKRPFDVEIEENGAKPSVEEENDIKTITLKVNTPQKDDKPVLNSAKDLADNKQQNDTNIKNADDETEKTEKKIKPVQTEVKFDDTSENQ